MKARLSIYLDAESIALADVLLEENENTSQFIQRMIKEAAAARGYSIKRQIGIYRRDKLVKEI
jgi:hypothetical protein